MTSAKIFNLGNGHTRATLINHTVRHGDGFSYEVVNVSTICPDCKMMRLIIEEGRLRCKNCGLTIRLVSENQNFCSFCGSDDLVTKTNTFEVECQICHTITNINNQTLSTTIHVQDNEYDDEIDDDSETDYESTKDVFGFNDDDGNYHRYDDE